MEQRIFGAGTIQYREWRFPNYHKIIDEVDLDGSEESNYHGCSRKDFHNFNTYFRDNSAYHVVAFTAAQIPDIEGRLYPPSLAGKLYPKGSPSMQKKSCLN